MESNQVPLDHYLVTWDGLWGRGKSMEEAQRNRLPHFLPNEKLSKSVGSLWIKTKQRLNP